MFIYTQAQLDGIVQNIPDSEAAKVAVIRPTDKFQIVTADNPDMVRTLEAQAEYVQLRIAERVNELNRGLSEEEHRHYEEQFRREFQDQLSEKALAEQRNFLRVLSEHGVRTHEILEDKGSMETAEFDYFTDQIFATDTGQYYDHDGQLSFIPSRFRNRQRQGEERLAIQQAKNLGATIHHLTDHSGRPLVFEGGDIRQMPGKKLFFLGQSHRTEDAAGPVIAGITGYYVVPIKLRNEQFYHLDCCFLPLPEDAAVVYEGEYVLDKLGQQVLTENGWPSIVPGTETMAPESRALIRSIYQGDKLILITRDEALAYATNAALIQNKAGRFKLFVNGDSVGLAPGFDESQAIRDHQISFTNQHMTQILTATRGRMDVVEVPYSTMHRSGGSVRCTVQEMACTEASLEPRNRNPRHFMDVAEALQTQFDDRLVLARKMTFFSPADGQQQQNVHPASPFFLGNSNN